MTRAALYLRVSTDEQATSAETQETEARRFATARGWSVVAVYRDVGASGANFTTRPAFLRMLADTRTTPLPWEVLVIQRQDRLGRDAARSTLALEELDAAGVAVWSYADAMRLELDPMGKAMLTVRGAFAELERALTVARVTEGLRAAAEQQRATGGRCYGYRTERTAQGPRLVVYEPEARVVRELFEARARGEGLRALVGLLNARHEPAPRAGTGSWSPSAVRSILERARYRGVLEYGRTHKGYRAGTKIRSTTPERIITTDAPALRIVSEELWRAAQSTAPARGPRTKSHARYLLTGFARCAVCDGPMQVSRAKHGTTQRAVYLCGWARDRGHTVCTNHLRRPVEELDDAIVSWMERHLLTPAVVDVALAHMRRVVEAYDQTPATTREATAEALRDAEREAERITDVLARTDTPPDRLLARLATAEARATALRAELQAYTESRATLRDWPRLEADARRALADLRDLFTRDTQGARAVLAKLLATPLRCEVVEHDGRRRYLLKGRAALPAELCLPERPNFGEPSESSVPRAFTRPDGISLDIAALAA